MTALSSACLAVCGRSAREASRLPCCLAPPAGPRPLAATHISAHLAPSRLNISLLNFMSTVHHQHTDTSRQCKVQAARKHKPAESTAQGRVLRRKDIELAPVLRRRSGERRSGLSGLFMHHLEAASHDATRQPGPQQRGRREKEKRRIHDSDVRGHGERRAAQKDACALRRHRREPRYKASPPPTMHPAPKATGSVMRSMPVR